MPISRRYIRGDVTIVVWAIEETSEQLGAMLGDNAMLQQARTFGSEARRAEWLAVRLLLRAMLGNDVRIEYSSEGKPLLAGAPGHISVSHTQGYAVLGYSLQRPIAVDVEPATRKIGVARSFVIKDGECVSFSPEVENRYLLLRWTAYEAVYKLVAGDNYKERFMMPVFAPKQSGVFAATLQGCDGGKFALSYIFDGGLLLTICVASDDVLQISCL